MSGRVVGIGIAAALIVVSFSLSCSNGYKSSSSYPTAPAGGGGGGGGGTALELNSGSIAASGGVYAHTFNTAGSYPYHCSIHANMTGTITVVTSGGNAPVAAGMNGMTSFTNGTQTINVGSTITWTNGTTVTHTVTSN